jgi:arylsulfatase A-like enzyme
MLHPNYGKASDYTPEELQNLRAHYCAEAELVDRWVGRIFQKIDDLGLWDSTIVVFTTDHGTSLGEHNRTGKTNINVNDDRRWPLYPEIAHIPCLVAAPGLQGGRSLDLLAQPVDLLPTLLDLAGLDVTPPEPFHGRSFAPALHGEALPPLRAFAACGQFVRLEGGALPPTATVPMLYTPRWAYTPCGPYGGRELYDLEADPGAETNLAGEHPLVAGDLHEKFVQWLCDLNAPEAAGVFLTE